jgi:hypothetical protein
VSITPEKIPLECSRAYKKRRRDGPLGIWQSRSPFALLSSLLKDILWSVRILRGEVRSLVRRIDALRDKNNRRYFWLAHIKLGPLYEEDGPTGHLRLCKETFARNESIERMLAKYPWASGSDVVLFLYGWEMGREFSLDNACNKRTEMGQTSTSSFPQEKPTESA